MPPSESHDITKCFGEAEAIYKKALVRHLTSKGKPNILDLARAATQVEHLYYRNQCSQLRQTGNPITALDIEDMKLAAAGHRIELHHAEMKEYVAIMS
jgi:hypothetical protein